MTDDATYFWHEADGWRFTGSALIHGPFRSFAECVPTSRGEETYKTAAMEPDREGRIRTPLSGNDWVREAELARTDIGVRTANCLRNGGYLTIEEVQQASDANLLRISNLGRKTLKEIREVLGKSVGAGDPAA